MTWLSCVICWLLMGESYALRLVRSESDLPKAIGFALSADPLRDGKVYTNQGLRIAFKFYLTFWGARIKPLSPRRWSSQRERQPGMGKRPSDGGSDHVRLIAPERPFLPEREKSIN